MPDIHLVEFKVLPLFLVDENLIGRVIGYSPWYTLKPIIQPVKFLKIDFFLLAQVPLEKFDYFEPFWQVFRPKILFINLFINKFLKQYQKRPLRSTFDIIFCIPPNIKKMPHRRQEVRPHFLTQVTKPELMLEIVFYVRFHGTSFHGNRLLFPF